MNRLLRRSHHSGFVLITSLIFLIVMTLLAATAIRRSTLGEKLSNNMREQNLAFQAAEAALRFCQNNYETAGAIAIRRRGLEGMPTEWNDIDNWRLSGGIATQLPPNTVKNVAQQPQCLIEEWSIPPRGESPINLGAVHLITARGVGSTTNAVVWLQATLRDGSL
jgi:type IV pilus assembly protein PilX